jgi:hypothetical protein
MSKKIKLHLGYIICKGTKSINACRINKFTSTPHLTKTLDEEETRKALAIGLSPSESKEWFKNTYRDNPPKS